MLFIVEEKYAYLTLFIMINNVKKYYQHIYFIHDSTIQHFEP